MQWKTLIVEILKFITGIVIIRHFHKIDQRLKFLREVLNVVYFLIRQLNEVSFAVFPVIIDLYLHKARAFNGYYSYT